MSQISLKKNLIWKSVWGMEEKIMKKYQVELSEMKNIKYLIKNSMNRLNNRT